MLQKLLELRAKWIAEREALNNKIDGLDAAIAHLREGGAAVDEEVHHRKGRARLKQAVLDIVMENAKTGITANDVVDRAKALGLEFDRGSVSSLLSRLKREGVLTHSQEDGRYRPKGAEQSADDPSNVKILRAVQ